MTLLGEGRWAQCTCTCTCIFAVFKLYQCLCSSSSSTTTEVYQKKSKSELQRSIKRLKEENNMYNSLNSELSKKLNEVGVVTM